MKISRYGLRLALTLMILLCATAQAWAEPINAVLGDESWEARFGRLPVEGEDGEVARIQTHLRYVIAGLRATPTPALDEMQRTRRRTLLRALEVYTERGVFPRRSASDGYGVRRPQFIDARGVHCAVGEMIRVSGHPELARHIDRVHEFDYVLEMKVPALGAWADAWGFGARELAMIQPGYSPPPSLEGTMRMLERSAPKAVLTCGQEHKIPPFLKVRAKTGGRGGVTISLGQAKTKFAKCAISKLQVRFGGAWRGAPERFDEVITLKMPSPKKLLQERFERLRFHSPNNRCLPGPAPMPVPKKVTLRVYTNARGHGVEVKTEPSYPETETCIAAYAKDALQLTAGHWDVDLTSTREVEPLVRTSHVQSLLKSYAENAAARCHDKGAPKGKLRVGVSIRQADQSFDFVLGGGEDAFKACMRKALEEGLRGSYTRSWRKPDGTFERYMRLDADVSVSVTFVPETQKMRRARFERERRRYMIQ